MLCDALLLWGYLDLQRRSHLQALIRDLLTPTTLTAECSDATGSKHAGELETGSKPISQLLLPLVLSGLLLRPQGRNFGGILLEEALVALQHAVQQGYLKSKYAAAEARCAADALLKQVFPRDEHLPHHVRATVLVAGLPLLAEADCKGAAYSLASAVAQLDNLLALERAASQETWAMKLVQGDGHAMLAVMAAGTNLQEHRKGGGTCPSLTAAADDAAYAVHAWAAGVSEAQKVKASALQKNVLAFGHDFARTARSVADVMALAGLCGCQHIYCGAAGILRHLLPFLDDNKARAQAANALANAPAGCLLGFLMGPRVMPTCLDDDGISLSILTQPHESGKLLLPPAKRQVQQQQPALTPGHCTLAWLNALPTSVSSTLSAPELRQHAHEAALTLERGPETALRRAQAHSLAAAAAMLAGGYSELAPTFQLSHNLSAQASLPASQHVRAGQGRPSVLHSSPNVLYSATAIAFP